MYEEIQSLDLRNSNGIFSLTMNDGSGSRTDSTGLTLDRIFANRGTLTLGSTTCVTGSGVYSPNVSDGRNLVIQFRDETMSSWEPIPAQHINFAPYAFEAKQVAGFTADSLLRVVNGTGDPLTGISPLSNAQWTELQALIAGTSVQYTHAGQIAGSAAPAMTSGQVLGWNGSAWTSVDPLSSVSSFAKTAMPACAAGEYLRNNGSGLFACSAPPATGGTVTQVNTGTGLTGGGFTTTGTISIAAGGVGTTELAALAVTSAKIALQAVDTAQLKDASVTTVKLADGSIATVKLADGSVTLVKMAADSVDSSKILDGSIVGADLSPSVNITTSGTVASGVSTTRDLKLYPASGSFKISFAAPTLTADYTLVFPADDGTPSQVLTTDGNGVLTWTTPAGTGISALTGDVTASGTGSVPATVASVGGSTAALVHTAELAANAAASANTASTIMKRDASGNFAASAATLNSVVLKDTGSNTVTLQAPSSVGTSYVLKMPTAVAPSTQLLQSDATGQLSYVAMPTALPPNGAAGGDLSGTYPNPVVTTVGTSTAANVHAAELLANAATSAATNSAIVRRDSTGNFVSNVATLNGVTLNNGGSLLNIVNPVGGAWTMTLPATAGSNGQVLTTDGSGNTNWMAQATSPWTVQAPGINYMGGNVGIGTTSAISPLDVNGTATFGTSSDRTTASGGMVFGNVSDISGSTFGVLSSTSNLALKPATGGTNLFAIAYHDTSTASMMSALEVRNSAGAGKLLLMKSGGNVGIGTTAPATKLEVSGTLRVGDGGETCGATYAGGVRYNGGNIQFCNGTAWSTLGVAGAGVTALTGDVTASGTGSVAATVASVGGSTAAAVNTATIAANAATTANTVSTIVKRDGSGNFAASGATLTSVILKDTGSNTVTVQAPATVATSYALKLPTAVSGSTQLLQSDNTGQLSYIAMPTSMAPSGSAAGDLSGTYPNPGVATVGGSTAANVNTATVAANAATAADTVSTIVKRDGSGNFAANTITTDSSVVLKGATTGAVTMQAPSSVTSWTMVMPATAGSNNQVLTTNGSGTLSWATPATGGATNLDGLSDVIVSSGNMFLGTTAGSAVTTGTNNTSLGKDALLNVTTTTGAVAIGANALKSLSTNNGAVAIGNNAFTSATSASGVAIGTQALKAQTGSSYSQVVVGWGALSSVTTGDNNTALGDSVGLNMLSGSNNVFIGANAGASATVIPDSSNILIGYNTQVATNGQSNYLNIGNAIYGNLSSGNVGIGTTAPNLAGWGAGSKVLSLRGSGNAANGASGVLELIGDQADNSGNLTGAIDFVASGNTGNNEIAQITAVTFGGSTNNRGGALLFSTKASGSNGVERMRIDHTGNVGIGTTAPATKLAVSGSVLVGDGGETCGATYAGAIRYNGGNLQFCNGTPPWSTLGIAGSGITALTGDVTASGTGSVAATVASVGGSAAIDVHTAELAVAAATNLPTASKLVKRDPSGAIGVSSVIATTYLDVPKVIYEGGNKTASVLGPANAPSAYQLTLPNALPASSMALMSDAAGSMTWSALPSALPPNGAAGGDLNGTYPNPAVAQVGGVSAANVASGANAANAAVSANTVSTIVKRDGTGNFVSNVATLNGVTLNNAGSLLNIVNPVGGAWTMTLPATAGSSGQVLTTDGAGLLSWSAAGGSSQWTTQAPGINYIGGNVGIGTTSPNTRLTVDAASAGNVANAAFLNSSMANNSAVWTWFGRDASTNNAGQIEFNYVSSGSANNSMSLGFLGSGNKMTVLAGGNVGIGTTSPRVTLDVNGVIASKAATDRTSSTTIDFSSGNIQYTNDSCQPYQFNNLMDGATYTFVVKGTASATCSFTAYSDSGSTLLTTHLPPGHVATTTGKHTMYSLMVVGSDVYFSWIPGY